MYDLRVNASTIFLVILFSLLSFNSVQAQIIKELPYSSDEYFTQLEVHFERVQAKDKKVVKNFLKDLNEKWTSGYFSDAIKQKIYVTSNLMLDNKMRAKPYFFKYFQTIISTIDKSLPDATILKWMESVDLILNEKKNRNFLEYLDNSNALFAEGFIFSNRLIQWRTDGDWTIEVDSNIRYIFPLTNLVCYTKKDSSNLYITKGVFYPLTNEWKGQGGLINWQRADFDPNDMYAKLKDYRIRLKMSKFKADSVEFYYHRYFDKPIQGTLEEQILASRHGSKALYPRFSSYTKQWKIPEIFEDISFSGGFRIEGAKFIGEGDEYNPAVLVFKRKGEKFITLKSKSFSIETNRIRSQYASITIHYEQDSIYHNGLRMSYTNDKRQLSMIRDEKGLRADPFFDTFHQLDMFVEAAYWNMNEDKMDFDMIKGMNKRPAFFESNNRYSLRHFEELQYHDEQNPLSTLNQYVTERMSDVVYIVEYAQYLRLPYEQVKLQLLALAHEGFVLYDSENDKIVVKDRVKFYLDARSQKVDYDVILFKSDSTKLANAELKLDSFDLRINGVQRIILSDSQNLIIEPGDPSIANGDYIVVGKNRNFTFNGKVEAGRFSFKASGCKFDYNAFKLDMPQIDSLWFWVDGDPLPTGGRERKPVHTALVNLSGDILIDHPTNKSGLKAYDDYPIFNSKEDSYAYYDQPTTEKGVYIRDRFYFRISPFVLTALADIETKNIQFEGYLYSGGIFPDIAQTLRVMNDYSLGFVTETPESGLIAYGDKGVFHRALSLSNKGLRGNGNLHYLTSTTVSSDFVFYLDSMNVYSDRFKILSATAPVEFPKVNGDSLYQHWLPYQDRMNIYTLGKKMDMYDDYTKLDGMLELRPKGLLGKGDIHFKVAVMTADLYKFQYMTFQSDTVYFVDDGWKLNNFKAETNYHERKVLFTSNGGASLVEFTDNQYICYMDEAAWFMDLDETIYSKKNSTEIQDLAGKSRRELADVVIEGSEFISLHPDQDSLQFFSSKASFNSGRKIIKAEGVVLLRIADAAIFPKDNLVTILKGAEMVPLEDASILANTTTKYHEISEATVRIKGRMDYRGTGNYIYIDLYGMEQNIYFDNIKVDTTLQTTASGTVYKEDDFTLSPAFTFYGDAHLFASRKNLEFDGGFKVKSACVKGDNWVHFKSIIDPENVLIPIPKQPHVPDITNTRKFLGIANSPTEKKIYSLFFQDKKDYFDSVLITADGFLTYDYNSAEYKISTQEKLLQLSRPDNYISYNPKTCNMYAEGKVIFDIRTDDVKISSYGILTERSGKAKIKVASAIDFHFSEKALEEMILVFQNQDYNQSEFMSDFHQKVAGGYMGIEAADKYISKSLMGQQKKIPEDLQHTIFISEMNMRWHKETNSYLSKGKINIAGFLKKSVNAKLEGYVEFRKIRSGDEMNIYFLVGGEWFFFNYKLNVMQVLSSNDKFNAIIKEEVTGKGKKNRLKAEDERGKKSTYRYILSTSKKKDDFLLRIKPYI